MSREPKVIKHKDFEKDLSELDGSLRKQAQKKVDAIIGDEWRNQGHRLTSDLSGFRSASFQSQTYYVLFSYCDDCRKVGRNTKYISACPFCAEVPDDTTIFWRIFRHRDGERNGYREFSRAMSKEFPPSPSESL